MLASPRSKWMRGLATAAAASISKSSRLQSTCRMAVRSRLDPPEPTAISRSRPTARVGAIMEETRVSVGQQWNPVGLRSSSPSMLFTMMPVPGSR